MAIVFSLFSAWKRDEIETQVNKWNLLEELFGNRIRRYQKTNPDVMVPIIGFKWQAGNWLAEEEEAAWLSILDNLLKVKRGLKGEKNKNEKGVERRMWIIIK